MTGSLNAHVKQLSALIAEQHRSNERFIFAIAGPPASGKSTLAEALVKKLGHEAILVPMDGFHLDNRIIEPRGLLSRKGSPPTFDGEGFASLIERIKAFDKEIAFPIFDRDMDCAIAGAGMVQMHHTIVVLEGNYLLLDDQPWNAIRTHYDATAFLELPIGELEARLIARWKHHGWPDDKARKHIAHNDLPNIALVQQNSVSADIVLKAQ